MTTNNKIRLFCDSQIVFEQMVKSGLVPESVTVFTRSFVLAEDNRVNSVYLDEKLSSAERHKFKLEIKPAETELAEQINKMKISQGQKIIFLQLYNKFQNEIFDACLLGDDAEFDGKTIIAIPRSGQMEIDEVVRPCWIDWLVDKENISLIDVNVPYHNERSPRGNVQTNIVNKIKLGGWQALLWKLAQKNLLPSFILSTGIVGVVGQTELLRDAVAECILKKQKPVFIQKPNLVSSGATPDFTEAETIISIVGKTLENHFSRIPNQYLRNKAFEIFAKRLAAELGQYNVALEYWQKKVVSLPQLKFILSGYSSGPYAMAMTDCCTKAGIKIVAFQHGITREMLSNAEERSIFFETSFCDLFITMNKMSAVVTKKMSIRTVPAAIKYWPSTFRRLSRHKKATSSDLLFVSTNLYSGHKPNGVPPTSDLKLCAAEKRIVEQVLGKINKRICYKPYPAIRQLDKDPVISAVRSQPNMSVVGAHEDLRYLLNQYDMFITTRATSTVSWIIATERPLIFIDHFCHARLSKEAKDAFYQAFFLFDQSEACFEDELRKFLQQPREKIHAIWAEKKLERQQVIQHFFSGPQVDCSLNNFGDMKY